MQFRTHQTWLAIAVLACGLWLVASPPAFAQVRPEFRFNPHVPLQPEVAFDHKNPWLWLSNKRVKVGMNLEYGGAICWVSEAGSSFNMVNWHDPGRQIQTSVFAHDGYGQLVQGGPDPKLLGGYEVWNWNPCMAGDARGHRSPVIAYEVKDNHMHVRCQPLNWGGMASAVSLRGKSSPDAAPAAAYFNVDVSLDGPVVKITFSFDYWDKESHGLCEFEAPAVYPVAPLNHFWCYTGKHPWTGRHAEDLTANVPLDMTKAQYHVTATENWGAWVDHRGVGMTIYQPGTKSFNAGTFYPYGPMHFEGLPLDESWGKHYENHYLAGWKYAVVDAQHQHFAWDLYVIVGKVDEARRIIEKKLHGKVVVPPWPGSDTHRD